MKYLLVLILLVGASSASAGTFWLWQDCDSALFKVLWADQISSNHKNYRRLMGNSGPPFYAIVPANYDRTTYSGSIDEIHVWNSGVHFMWDCPDVTNENGCGHASNSEFISFKCGPGGGARGGDKRARGGDDTLADSDRDDTLGASKVTTAIRVAAYLLTQNSPKSYDGLRVDDAIYAGTALIGAELTDEQDQHVRREVERAVREYIGLVRSGAPIGDRPIGMHTEMPKDAVDWFNSEIQQPTRDGRAVD